MHDLHPYSTRQEIARYCELCQEHKVLQVSVDAETLQNIGNRVGQNPASGVVIFLGIKFAKK